jgi:hypothetical protein
MKNLHVLPTDKPSRLIRFFTNKYYLCKEILPIQDEERYMNIYITSDEEIKDGDWMIRGNEQPTLVTPNFFWDFGVRYYKIILTTDQDLINDGVQAIDDDFLEWFVKNPSCESAEVYHQLHKDEPLYKIINPQEEPKQKQKQHLIEIMRGDEELGLYDEPKQIKCYCGHTTYCDCGPQEERACTQDVVDSAMKAVSKDVRLPKIVRDGLVTKQETLKKASLQYRLSTNNKMGIEQVAFESGAKWQAKRMYSEEDMAESFMACWKANVSDGIECKLSFKEWFEQFKKK